MPCPQHPRGCPLCEQEQRRHAANLEHVRQLEDLEMQLHLARAARDHALKARDDARAALAEAKEETARAEAAAEDAREAQRDAEADRDDSREDLDALIRDVRAEAHHLARGGHIGVAERLRALALKHDPDAGKQHDPAEDERDPLAPSEARLQVQYAAQNIAAALAVLCAPQREPRS